MTSLSFVFITEIRKVLSKIAKEKGFEELAEWIKPCENHLHWSATTTFSGNGLVIWAKFKSFLWHIFNVHSNHEDALFDKCAHGSDTKQRELSKKSEQVPPRECFRCGFSWPHKDQPCPAEGQQCNNCKKYNHFARVCRSTRRKPPSNEVHKIAQTSQQVESDDNDEYVYTLETPPDKAHFQKLLKIGNSEVTFQIDTGSTANIIHESSDKHLASENPTFTLVKSKNVSLVLVALRPYKPLDNFNALSSHHIK